MSAVQVFCSALKSQPNSSAGIKVSGGIRDKKTALEYISLVEKELNWDIAPATFRIGASSLAGELLSDTVWAEIWNG
jgi:deoxyribose-phosphate aldolase